MDLINQASSWAEPSMVDGKIYYWMSRNKVIDEIPVAYKKADTVYRAFKTLASKGLISYIKDGRRDLVAFTEKGKTWNVKGTDIGDAKLGNKSELAENSEINPSKLGNKSEKTPKNSEISPTDKNTNNKSISNKKRAPKTDSKKEDVFKPVKPEQVSDQTWNDLLALRKKKGAIDSQTAWTRINNSLERAQQATGHTLENIFSYWVMRAWAGFDEKWYINAHPQQPTNNTQGNTHANNQSANNKPRRETTDEYKQRMQREFNEEFGIEVQPDSHTDCYS
ncbi:hypothetical protein [Psychrobacter celer]|uniref:hypothetical protein n=1 Tax=Psychrobacter celer TaxID=306572 RepID=UPI003FCFF5EC